MEAWLEKILSENRRNGVSEPACLAALTLVIPSYGRQDFLMRQAAYWGFSAANVFMLDGSPEPLDWRARALLETAPNIVYRHAPESVARRLQIASGLVRTPYAVLHGDDEFFLKTGLGRAIDRLNADDSLASCIGQSLTFGPAEGNGEIEFRPAYAHWRHEIPQESARDRLLAAMQDYNAATSYAVLRTPTWIRSWGSQGEWSCPYAYELYQAIVTYIHGKLASVDDLVLLRSVENRAVSDRGTFDRRLRFHDWWKHPDYAAERERFLGELGAELAVRERRDPEEGRMIVLEAIEAYLEFCARCERLSASASPAAVMRAGMSKWAHQALGRGGYLRLKRAVYALAGKGGGGYFGDPGLASPDAEAIRELDGIKRLVTEFHERKRERAGTQ
jgi:glycosyltransferase domain-containing protein